MQDWQNGNARAARQQAAFFVRRCRNANNGLSRKQEGSYSAVKTTNKARTHNSEMNDELLLLNVLDINQGNLANQS